MKVIQQHIAHSITEPIRLQEYAVGLFQEIFTKSAVKKAIKKNQLQVNGKPTSTAYFIQNQDIIQLLESIKSTSKIYHLDLKVLYEDDFLAIVDKPAGISVSGNKFASIANSLSPHISPSSQIDASLPFPVHRLDYPTSGCLMIGKTATAKRALHNLFENQEIHKTYHAVCIGNMKENSGLIDFPIENKQALTSFKLFQSIISTRFDALNLVALHPITGRKHQLRQHLFHIGNPIMGDQQYFIPDKKHQGYGLYLHATSLEFTHPITSQKLRIQSDLPKKFTRLFPDFSSLKKDLKGFL